MAEQMRTVCGSVDDVGESGAPAVADNQEVAGFSGPITVYTPESPLRHPRAMLRSMLRDLMASRELARSLFIRNLSAQFRQTALGYLWLFLAPLAMSLTFIFLRSSGVFTIGETVIPYPVYVLIGTLLWQGFVDALGSPLKVVAANKSILVKLNIPREALILAGLTEVLFNLAIRLILIAIIMACYRIVPPVQVFLFPVNVVLLVLLGLSMGLVLVPVGMLYTDVQRGLQIITGFWVFLTPVVYPPPERWPASLLTHLNPVSPLLVTCRELLTTGELTRLWATVGVALGSLVLLFFGWVLYRLAMPILIERMGG